MPTRTPTAIAARRPIQTGTPPLISTPATTAAIVAEPGTERSRAPLRTPKPTDAPKIAVSAAAFAMSAALLRVKKYGAAQKAKITTSSSQRTMIPRSRRNTRVRTPEPPPASAGAAAGAASAARPCPVLTMIPVPLTRPSALLRDDLDGRLDRLARLRRVGRELVQLLQVLHEVLLEVERDVGVDLAVLHRLLRLLVAAGADDAGLRRVLAGLVE